MCGNVNRIQMVTNESNYTRNEYHNQNKWDKKKKIIKLSNIGKHYFEYILQGPQQQNCTNSAHF